MLVDLPRDLVLTRELHVALPFGEVEESKPLVGLADALVFFA
jgi:hypothetical protein